LKLLYIHHEALLKNNANIVQVLEMCYAFAKTGVNVTLAVPRSKGLTHAEIIDMIQSKLGKPLIFSVITFYQIKIAGRAGNFGIYFGLLGLLRSCNDFDLCLTRSVIANDLALRMGFDVAFESHSTILSSKFKMADSLLRRKLIKNSRKRNQVLFITISLALADYWSIHYVPAEKIVALHDAVCHEEFETVLDCLEARRILNLPLNRKIVVYAGRLYENRGIDHIIRLAEIFADVTFIVLGGPANQKEKYASIAKSKLIGNIVFVGQIAHGEVKKYLFAADVLLMLWSWDVPTIYICSPLKVFEYMAAERIIVGQAFPTITEVLEDGKNALLADPDSFDELRDKMKIALSTDYPNVMSKNARETVLRLYTWQKRVQEILGHLGELSVN
jgi:glycosyltransferase involved in cell wall biosynthesis